jgi:hypothetical protein
MACRMGAVAYDAATPAWQVAHVTAALDGVAFWASADRDGVTAHTSDTVAARQVITAADRALAGQITAYLSLACGFFAISALRVDRQKSKVGFKVVWVALEDPVEEFQPALRIASLGE